MGHLEEPQQGHEGHAAHHVAEGGEPRRLGSLQVTEGGMTGLQGGENEERVDYGVVEAQATQEKARTDGSHQTGVGVLRAVLASRS